MRVELVSHFEALLPLRKQWNHLLQGNETNTVFQTFEWHQSWWKVYGDSGRLCTLLVFSEDKLAGIAPLMKIRYGRFGELIQFIGEGRSDYCDFIIAEQKEKIVEKILEYFHQNKISWDTLHLNHIPEYSSTINIVKEICSKAKQKYLVKRIIDCPTIFLNDPEHIQSIINKKSLRRRNKYFSQNGALQYVEIEDYDEAMANLEIFFEQHKGRVNLKGMRSLFQNDINRNFYHELLKNMFDKGWVVFSRLDFNSIPLAYHFGFIYNQTFIWYKPSFNAEYNKKSPGLVLIRYLIDHALKKNLREFDFTVGNEEFKSRFANGLRHNIQLEIYREGHIYLYSLFKQKLINLLEKKRNK